MLIAIVSDSYDQAMADGETLFWAARLRTVITAKNTFQNFSPSKYGVKVNVEQLLKDTLSGTRGILQQASDALRCLKTRQ